MHDLDSPWFELALVGLCVLILVAIMAPCFGFGLLASNQKCNSARDIMGLTVQWRVFGGCFVEIEEGKYIPLKDYHYVQGINP